MQPTAIILGAGVTGLSTAYHLAQKKFGRIILLDKGPVGDEWFMERIRHGAKKTDGTTIMPAFEGTFSQEAMWAIRAYVESKFSEQ